MPAVGQTVTIVNQSGKIVKTSKTLVNVFKEARSAYSERKAEIKALRRQEEEDFRRVEHHAKSRLEALTIADDDDRRSHASSRRSSRSRTESANHIKRKPVSRSNVRPPLERGVTDSFYVNDLPTPTTSRTANLVHLQHEAPRIGELTRRHTDGPSINATTDGVMTRLAHRNSADHIDMDLAYGELPPPLPERKYDTEVELRSKMSGLQQLLDECNCVQHSVMATIENLQKNPDALAAVALTLAEISNLATKLAPGALTSLKAAFPTILALLASPQFAIAAGVGIGVTIVAFGGYKIIKKIKAQRENETDARLLAYGESPSEPKDDELRELNSIERWRRGIADVEAGSAGTSVEGELITPQATRTLISEGRLRESDLKSTTGRSRTARSRRAKSDAGDVTNSRGKKSEKARHSSGDGKVRRKKEPSGLRMLFKTRDAV